MTYFERLPLRVVSINGQQLTEMRREHDVGVSEESTYRVKRLNSDNLDD
jgi:restriction endonuclease Mrr